MRRRTVELDPSHGPAYGQLALANHRARASRRRTCGGAQVGGAVAERAGRAVRARACAREEAASAPRRPRCSSVRGAKRRCGTSCRARTRRRRAALDDREGAFAWLDLAVRNSAAAGSPRSSPIPASTPSARTPASVASWRWCAKVRNGKCRCRCLASAGRRGTASRGKGPVSRRHGSGLCLQELARQDLGRGVSCVERSGAAPSLALAGVSTHTQRGGACRPLWLGPFQRDLARAASSPRRDDLTPPFSRRPARAILRRRLIRIPSGLTACHALDSRRYFTQGRGDVARVCLRACSERRTARKGEEPMHVQKINADGGRNARAGGPLDHAGANV